MLRRRLGRKGRKRALLEGMSDRGLITDNQQSTKGLAQEEMVVS
jgi:hypothetical protein